MNAVVLSDAREFLDRAGALLADEARNNLILGIARGIVDKSALSQDHRLYIVERDGSSVAAAIITPPHNLLVADASDIDAVRRLVRTVHDDKLVIPGVSGGKPTVVAFKDVWTELTGATAVLEMDMGVFSIEAVRDVPVVAGGPRRATMGDVDLVVDWMMSFADEALPGGRDAAERLPALARHRLEGASGSAFWLWEIAGDPVAISGHATPTGSGIRINGVYTPRAMRRNGYATSLVAYQSRWLLNNGYRYCCLYTDLANPTSNAIYRQIGYHQVAESAMYSFS